MERLWWMNKYTEISKSTSLLGILWISFWIDNSNDATIIWFAAVWIAYFISRLVIIYPHFGIEYSMIQMANEWYENDENVTKCVKCAWGFYIYTFEPWKYVELNVSPSNQKVVYRNFSWFLSSHWNCSYIQRICRKIIIEVHARVQLSGISPETPLPCTKLLKPWRYIKQKQDGIMFVQQITFRNR